MGTNYFTKGLSLLILAIVVHMHYCSFACSTGVSDCCGTEHSHQTGHHKEAKHHDSDGGCQKEHQAFFKTVGQYHFVSDNIVKYFPVVVAEIVSQVNLLQVQAFPSTEIYTGFHPPPPKGDVRILIQSFQI